MNTLFTCLASPHIAALIRGARKRVCYAAPGIQEVSAQALVETTQEWLHQLLEIAPEKSLERREAAQLIDEIRWSLL